LAAGNWEVEPVLHLRITEGMDQGDEIKTRDSSISIGRDSGCRLVLKDKTASRVHGELYVLGDRVMYRDLMSHNGSTVLPKQGESIELTPLLAEWPMTPGDRIRIGGTIVQLVEARVEHSELSLDPAHQMTVAAPMETISPPLGDEIFAGLQQLRGYDTTSVYQAKNAVARGLLSVFRQAGCVAIVDIEPAGKSGFSVSDIKHNEHLIACRDGVTVAGGYSTSVLAEAYRRRAVVLFCSRQTLPDADSVESADIGSCMCAPLLRGSEITGFIHVHTTSNEPRGFSARDAQQFAVLTSVAGVLIEQAEVAREQTSMRAMAAAGRVVAGLSHDASAILGALDRNAGLVEKQLPDVKGNPWWRYLLADLKLLSRLCRDVRSCLLSETRELEPCVTSLYDVIEDVLDRCRHFFIDEADRPYLHLSNECDRSSSVLVDRDVLLICLMNCVKNSIDAYRSLSLCRRESQALVRLISVPDPHKPDEYCAVSVVDDAGGIDTEIFARLGKTLVSKKGDKGCGLGVSIVLHTAERLNAPVQIATSREPISDLPAGTVVTMCLPSKAATSHPLALGVLHKATYHEHRQRVGVAGRMSCG
jgi:pSer/pThr/pTyr-binding forkhead associated (FHA) protein/nitrogen-specific signal transduction histidine kinase